MSSPTPAAEPASQPTPKPERHEAVAPAEDGPAPARMRALLAACAAATAVSTPPAPPTPSSDAGVHRAA